MALHRFLEEFQRSNFVSGSRHKALEHFAFVVDGSRKVMVNPIDLHKGLIKVPSPLSMLTHGSRAFRSDLAREDRTEAIDPEPHALMADVDPAFVQQVFHISKRQRKPDIHHHRTLNDLRRRLEMAER